MNGLVVLILNHISYLQTCVLINSLSGFKRRSRWIWYSWKRGRDFNLEYEIRLTCFAKEEMLNAYLTIPLPGSRIQIVHVIFIIWWSGWWRWRWNWKVVLCICFVSWFDLDQFTLIQWKKKCQAVTWGLHGTENETISSSYSHDPIKCTEKQNQLKYPIDYLTGKCWCPW